MKAFKKMDKKQLSKIVGGSDSYIPVLDMQVAQSAQTAAYIPVLD